MTCSKNHYIHQDKTYAGYIDIKKGSLFYYHIPHVNNKLVIWLNGGPGCSSDVGLLLENGPKIMRVNGEQEDNNEYGWHKLANMVYVDQPLNTGFSQGIGANSEADVVTDFTEFMAELLDMYPQFKDMEIYLSGESYAGTYIPYIAQGLLKYNLNVKGLLMGNGWMDPSSQYRSYIEYSKAHGLLLDRFNSEIEKKWTKCEASIKKSNRIFDIECEQIAGIIFQSTRIINNGKCTNMYDIRLIEDNGCGENWPYALPQVYKYLQSPATMEKLHVNKTWVECNSKVYRDLSADRSKPSVELLPELLKQIPVLLFNGDKDFICNHIGQENMIKKLTWNNQQGFKNDPLPIVLNGIKTAEIQSENNLLYMKIYNASHMVPIDQPETTYHMLKHFLEGTLVVHTDLDQ
eukprot:NODE_45_length_27728_cov_0.328387.p2 type:complete len:404 gc:universal NODE_45_length_27728_cov_0.328387:10661-9450(-)